ncbi:MAG: hypothetical protein K2P99_04720 [Burkholderiales bacterium]|nr:hypothetical protein [Burkholderiales bacterium]
MSKNKINYEVLDKAFNSAPMQESKSVGDEKMKKLISIPIEWDDRIKRHFKGTVNSYILMAIYERMQKDGIV